MTKTQFKFLSILARYERPLTRSDLCQITGQRFASAAETSARNACRKMGYAEFVGGLLGGGVYAPKGWRITKAGRAALAAREADPS